MRSANARYAVNALCGVGRAAVLSERGPEIAAAIAGLDPAQSPEIAADAGRVALLLTLALPDPDAAPRGVGEIAWFLSVSGCCLTEGRGGTKTALLPPLPSEGEGVRGSGKSCDCRTFCARRRGGKGTAPGRFALTTIYDMLRADAPFSEPLAARSRFYPEEECLLPLSRGCAVPAPGYDDRRP